METKTKLQAKDFMVRSSFESMGLTEINKFELETIKGGFSFGKMWSSVKNWYHSLFQTNKVAKIDEMPMHKNWGDMMYSEIENTNEGGAF